jgi:1-acyl-sn-glycerol-3-phosphate acyltransferase
LFRPYCLSDGDQEKIGSELTKMLKTLHSAIFWFLVFFYSIVINKLSYFRAVFVKSSYKKKLFYQKGARLWGSLILRAAHVKVEVNGLENVPKDTNLIFVANHQSYLDIFVLLRYLPVSFKFVIMRKLFKVPFIGDHIVKCGFLSLDTKDRKNSIRTINRIVDLLGKNRSFMIFPEGKLTRDGSIGNFGRGTSIIVQRSGKPVVPIAIDGTFSVLPKGVWKLSPGVVKLNIGKPVIFSEYFGHTDKSSSLELGEKLREIILELKEK